MVEILNTKNIVAVTATANVIKKLTKCNVRWQSFGSPPDHCITWIGGPTGFLVDSGHRSTLILSPAVILESPLKIHSLLKNSFRGQPWTIIWDYSDFSKCHVDLSFWLGPTHLTILQVFCTNLRSIRTVCGTLVCLNIWWFWATMLELLFLGLKYKTDLLFLEVIEPGRWKK